MTSPASEGFDHTANRLAAAVGNPNHLALDTIAATGMTGELTGVFTYGSLSVDMGDELVRAYVDDCSGWRPIGEVRTDKDGYATIPTPDDLGPGSYEVRFEVAADGSQIAADLWILPPGTHITITDIDSTLTTADSALWDELVEGIMPPAYEGASDLTQAHDSMGEIVVYLTGRPYWLAVESRAWLDDLGFAPGPLHLNPTNQGAVPTDGYVGQYKLDYLRSLTDAGFILDEGYGNASTDIFAYLSAGLAQSSVWIIGPHAGEEGVNGVTGSWAARAEEVLDGPIVKQPFER